MFERLRLKAQIKRCKARIAELEQKRVRSQASLVDSIITKKEPNDEDVDYFNKFTYQITAERAYLQRLTMRLEALDANRKTK